MSNNYLKDMKTIDNIIKGGNNYNRYASQIKTKELFSSNEPFTNTNQYETISTDNPVKVPHNMNLPNPNQHITPSNDGKNKNGFDPNMNSFNISNNNTFLNKDPYVNNNSNPVFKHEATNPFLGRMTLENPQIQSQMNMTTAQPKNDNTDNTQNENKEDFKNVSDNERKPAVKLFILGIIIAIGFAVALSWHEVSKYYIARSIKFYKGTSLYYIYYACSLSILFLIILIINYYA